MFNLILFGPPGSGKGTQSEKLIARYGLKHLSTGDLLRSEIAAQTSLGIAAKTLMDKGQLVPDEVVIGMIDAALVNNPKAQGFLFDGFPRTKAQSEALDALLAGPADLDAVISRDGPLGRLGDGDRACTVSHMRAWQQFLSSDASFALCSQP